MGKGLQRLATFVVCGLLAGCQSASQKFVARTQPSPIVSTPSPTSPAVRIPRETTVVALASHQEPENLPRVESSEQQPAGAPEVVEVAAGPLRLNDVILSVQQSYPLLMAAIFERDVADGKFVSAWGEFDLNLKAFGIAAPEGFYQTYRNGFAASQPLFRGGYLYGGYKIGDGNFQPWFKERETNEGGEFSAGFGMPLLKDRFIDERRAAVFRAELARQGVEPAIQTQMLEFVRVASQAYWFWVAAGRSLEAERELLKNAQSRVKQIQEKVKAGDLPQIARINNEQLIAARETKVIQSERKLQKAAIKLSLFLRDSEAEPVIPKDSQLPPSFPDPESPTGDQIDEDIQIAVAASPMLQELNLMAEQMRVELRNAENMMLPKLDLRLLASKDAGAPASSKGDKTPFELEAGIYGEIPLQRRKARGKIVSAEGKLAQINAKQQFVVNKITAAVRDAVSALQAAAGRIKRAQTNLRLARETLRLGRLQFDAGDSDLVKLNIYEKSVTSAQLLLISAQVDFFTAVANYRAALAQDPVSE